MTRERVGKAVKKRNEEKRETEVEGSMKERSEKKQREDNHRFLIILQQHKRYKMFSIRGGSVASFKSLIYQL